MSVASAIPTPTTGARGRRARTFTVQEFYRLAEAGVFGQEHHRLELLAGEILEPMPIGPEHAAAVTRLYALFSQRLGARFIVRSQNPVRLNDYSEPLPDLAVLRPEADGYRHAHPGPGDVLLLIEVADSTLSFDVGDKAHQYAQAGILEYWVLDLGSARVRVFRQPDQGEFTETRIAGRGQRLEPQTVAGFSVTVDELLA